MTVITSTMAVAPAVIHTMVNSKVNASSQRPVALDVDLDAGAARLG
jgi:hypothetical protein